MYTYPEQVKTALKDSVVRIVPRLLLTDVDAISTTQTHDLQADWQSGTTTGTTMNSTFSSGQMFLNWT